MGQVKLPADVELEDRLAFGFTAKQLALLAVTAICAYGAFLATAPLPTSLRVAPPVLVVAVGLGLALVRHHGLAGDQLAFALARFALAPKRQVLTDTKLARRLPGSPRQPRVAPLDIPVRRVLESGLVELSDGSYCQLLVAQGSSFELRGSDEQAAFVSVFERFLNACVQPVQLSVHSEPVSLAPQAARIEDGAAALPAGLCEAARDHARFLRSLGEARPLYRRRIVLTLRSREPSLEQAQLTLARQSAEAVELLRGAEVTLAPLDGEGAAALLAQTLDPPGPPDGSYLTGVIHAHPHPNR
jgi:hypothetical protein